jgi:hypothetical protein
MTTEITMRQLPRDWPNRKIKMWVVLVNGDERGVVQYRPMTKDYEARGIRAVRPFGFRSTRADACLMVVRETAQQA